MIILDETKLSQDTLARIARDYGIDINVSTVQDFDVLIEDIIKQFSFKMSNLNIVEKASAVFSSEVKEVNVEI